MKKIISVMLILGAIGFQLQAQKYFTKAGQITFTSDAPLEKIEAENKTVSSVMDIESGKIQFAALIKAFHFEKALMEEHFNENYMESDKFPKATFKGQIENLSDINFGKDGTYETVVSGQMTIHGETQEVKTTGTFTIADGKISAIANFEIAVADYGIKIPKVVIENIAKIVAINVNMNYQLLTKDS